MRRKKDYMMSERNIEYISEIKTKHSLKYNSEALDLIIREHRKNGEVKTDDLAEVIANKVSGKLKEDIKSLKFGLNSAGNDRTI